jgi:hypothetical protein
MNDILEDSMLPMHSKICLVQKFYRILQSEFYFVHCSPVYLMKTEVPNILISLFQLVDVFMSNWNFKLCWQILYCSVCLSDSPNDPSDFFPLSVHYQERLSAAGRTRYRNLKLFLPPFSLCIPQLVYFTQPYSIL